MPRESAPPPRLWLEFVNSEGNAERADALGSFESYVAWLERHDLLEHERGPLLRRRAQLQPAGATAALLEARRIRTALGLLADRGPAADRGRQAALAELNRVLGRSAGMRQIEEDATGDFHWQFVPAGDAFVGLLLPLVESATESLVSGELPRVRRCAAADCRTVFLDVSRNGKRRWCTMGACGNRAKQTVYRKKHEKHD